MLELLFAQSSGGSTGTGTIWQMGLAGVAGTLLAALINKFGDRRKTKDVDQAAVLFSTYGDVVIAKDRQIADARIERDEANDRTERAEAAAQRAEAAVTRMVAAEHHCQEQLAGLRREVERLSAEIGELKRDPGARTRREDR